MQRKMTKAEREAFLAEPRVAVLALGERGRGPLAVPIWYFYEPGGEVVFVTPKSSHKGKLMSEGGRISLCVQSEERPYRYVSVEGPISSIGTATTEDDVRPLAIRYLGEVEGNAYADARGPDLVDASMLVHMTPERWLTADFS
jgi:hypothetical protein